MGTPVVPVLSHVAVVAKDLSDIARKSVLPEPSVERSAAGRVTPRLANVLDVIDRQLEGVGLAAAYTDRPVGRKNSGPGALCAREGGTHRATPRLCHVATVTEHLEPGGVLLFAQPLRQRDGGLVGPSVTGSGIVDVIEGQEGDLALAAMDAGASVCGDDLSLNGGGLGPLSGVEVHLAPLGVAKEASVAVAPTVGAVATPEQHGRPSNTNDGSPAGSAEPREAHRAIAPEVLGVERLHPSASRTAAHPLRSYYAATSLRVVPLVFSLPARATVDSEAVASRSVPIEIGKRLMDLTTSARLHPNDFSKRPGRDGSGHEAL